ncbi:MAG TPA: DJ-1/PfpI family protein [Chitinophagaceae bacterium]
MRSVIIVALLMVSCAPLKEFKRIPEYKGTTLTGYSQRSYSAAKQNVFILADNKGTEIFDLIAPFYLFSLTGEANVYIVAKSNTPVPVMKGFFVLPHYTYAQVDSLGLPASAIVIPNFSGTKDDEQDPEVIEWIRRRYADPVRILSVCAGSFTAAATGLYDGKQMTTHASELAGNRRLFPSPQWQQHRSFTKDGRLYSTAGVSNAAEGSLALIRDMFGEASMRKVMAQIHYRYDTLKLLHETVAISPADKKAFLRKVLFRNDKHTGVLMQDGIDEFILAGILDSYHRTIPASLKTYTGGKAAVTSRFGLVLLPTGKQEEMKSLDELHVIGADRAGDNQKPVIRGLQMVHYDTTDKRYIFDICLERIGALYGSRFSEAVKRLLDYN